MAKRTNYYKNLAADYSKPGLVSEEVGRKLIEKNKEYLALREERLPEVNRDYTLSQIEQENKDWWPSHLEAFRQGRLDLLGQAYSAEKFVYLCQDGPFHTREDAGRRELQWVAILAQPGVTMTWPVVMFDGEVIYFEWQGSDDETGETVARGMVTFLRRGHRGGITVKTEHIYFFRDVHAPKELLDLIKL